MRIGRPVVSAFLVAVLIASAGSADPVTQAACPGAAVVGTRLSLGADVLENLAFWQGSLWISDSTASSIRRFDAAGAELAGIDGVSSPGGLAAGSDGLMYAGTGNAAAGSIARTGEAGVIRFDPAGVVTPFTSGFDMANGLAFDGDGNLWVSNDFGDGLVRIDPSGVWAKFVTNAWGMNGLVVDGGVMYAAVTFDQRSPILRLRLGADPAVESVMPLTTGVASIRPEVFADPDLDQPLVVKGLDDMTQGPDGALYVVGNGSGELLRVDPSTGDACVVAAGLQNPSSVRAAPEDGGFSDGNSETVDFWITEFSGRVRTVVYTP
ncbi:MAG: hypothetical protein WDA27_10135 [Actinomycetota bacterium]